MKNHYLLPIILFLIGGLFCSVNFVQAETNHIVISEIQIAGETADDEFIELYNPTGNNIDISGWSIQYKSATGLEFYKKNFVEGAIVPVHGFYLIAHKDFQGTIIPDMIHSTFSLSGGIKIGGGGNIFLVNDQKKLDSAMASTIVDKVAYGLGDSPETMVALLPTASTSIERKPGGEQGNGQDTDNNFNDFFHQESPNPQNSGSTPPPPPPTPEKAKVIINEIAWMGTLEDVYDEWIELFHNASSTISLTGWYLKISDDIIKLSGEITDYLVLDAGSLNNSGEILELYDAENNLIDKIDASSGWPKGNNTTKQTMERKPDGSWQTSLNPGGTPGAQNSAGTGDSPVPEPPPITTSGSSPPPTNHPPVAQAGSDQTILTGQEIIFDGSKSSDPDNDKLSFFWNFGDGQTSDKEKVSYVYNFPGAYLVTLTVSDNKLEATDALTIFVFSQGIIINEFDPINNWVELYNSSGQIINLENYKLNNFVFPKGSLIGANQYLVIVSESLENSLKLMYPNNQISQEIKFEEIKENSSINRISDQEYFWSSILTPGSVNFIGRGLIKQIPAEQTPVQDQSLKPITKPSLWSALAKSLTMQEQNPTAKVAVAKTKKSLISDAMGKFLLALSIAISTAFLLSFLLLKYLRRI